MKRPITTHLQSADEFNKRQLGGSLQHIPNFSDRHCRICLQEQGQLIQLPCGCIGQVGLIHEKCFTQWIQSLRNESSPFNRRARSLVNMQSNSYQIPCQICLRNIKLQIEQKRSLVSCKPENHSKIMCSVICLLFYLSLVGVVVFICINGIARSNNSGVIIFIYCTILVISIALIGWMIKREGQSLIIKNIQHLKIVTDRSKYEAVENEVFEFEIENNRRREEINVGQNRSQNSSKRSSGRRRRNRNRQ